MRSALFIHFQCLLAGASAPVFAQDGTLLDGTPFEWPKKIVDDMRTSMPEGDRLLAAVIVYRITYISDGLKVKGFLAEPAQSGRFRASFAMAKSCLSPIRSRTSGETRSCSRPLSS
ncbi:MAG: hypothetical protein JNN32_02045 [Flavobacteriales bacterium]|nr:hypothetical protein [Flavobacteriales bacterium]